VSISEFSIHKRITNCGCIDAEEEADRLGEGDGLGDADGLGEADEF
jgi:hypothetical protein